MHKPTSCFFRFNFHENIKNLTYELYFIALTSQTKEKENKIFIFIQIKSIWYYNVYILKLKLFSLKYNRDTSCRKNEYVHKANCWYKIQSTLIYGVHIVGIALMSKQRTYKFVTKILRKTCSSLVKIFVTERIILRKISTISC